MTAIDDEAAPFDGDPMASVPSPSTAFAEGTVLAGRFEILRFLGQGRMGEVYEARDLEIRSHVALMVICPELAADHAAMERFRGKAQLARQVTHENVCRIFDVFHHGEATFLAMEMLPGETLRARLRRTGRMSASEALPLLRDMAAALTAAHKAGIIHRHLNSDNVMLVPDADSTAGARAVVIGFGFAREAPADADSSGRIGISPYAALEQAEGKRITPATDVYALGVVAYEMVTGTLPFTGEPPSGATERLREAPVPPRSHAPDLDPRWEKVILRCLERDPERRFAGAARRGEGTR